MKKNGYKTFVLYKIFRNEFEENSYSQIYLNAIFYIFPVVLSLNINKKENKYIKF